MSDPIREAYDARRLLMQRLNAILDDRWPLAGKIMAAVDEYAEARSTPAEALDVPRLARAIHADLCHNDQPPCPVDEYDARRLAQFYREADHE